LHNTLQPLNVSGCVDPPPGVLGQPCIFPTAGDVILVINYINAKQGTGFVPPNTPPGPPYPDVTRDNYVVADDVMTLINWINAHPAQMEAEAGGPGEELAMLLVMDVAGQGKRKV
jgi:hypothetical protein